MGQQGGLSFSTAASCARVRVRAPGTCVRERTGTVLVFIKVHPGADVRCEPLKIQKKWEKKERPLFFSAIHVIERRAHVVARRNARR